MPDLEQSAVGTAIAQAFGEGATATVHITGFTYEQMATRITAAVAEKQQEIIELARNFDTTREAVLEFLKWNDLGDLVKKRAQHATQTAGAQNSPNAHT